MSATLSSLGGGDSGPVLVARAALARANGTVDADKRAHSPGCVACDQKIADRASADASAAQNAQLRAAAAAAAAGSGSGFSLLA